MYCQLTKRRHIKNAHVNNIVKITHITGLESNNSLNLEKINILVETQTNSQFTISLSLNHFASMGNVFNLDHLRSAIFAVSRTVKLFQLKKKEL